MIYRYRYMLVSPLKRFVHHELDANVEKRSVYF